MRAVKIVLVIWLLIELALWIRGGEGFSVIDALPFAQRPQSFPQTYELLASGALLIGLWGYAIMPRAETGQQPQQAPVGKRRFRAGLLLVPLSIIALAALSRRYVSTLHFPDIVGDPARLTEHRHLALLCVVVFAVLLLIKEFRNRF
jgi:hypothetical protein